MNKKIYILGGGTMSHVRSHMALCAPAFGKTAKDINMMINFQERFKNFDTHLVLTKMAESSSNIQTNDDVSRLVDDIIRDASAKIVFMNMALCDYDGQVGSVNSGKYSERLQTSDGDVSMKLTPAQKLIGKLRAERKDIFVVGFKTTCGQSEAEMFKRGLNLMKKNSINLVLANDVETRKNIIITPEEGAYKCSDREDAIEQLIDMAWHRTHLSFTRSNVVDGQPVAWQDSKIPSSLREVVNWCIDRNAYKVFNGVTTGHFATKLSDSEFLTSIRKTNFNDIKDNGMVFVKTDGPDNVIAMGAKPSVGGQSQRIIFKRFQETDCIVHFHCPLLDNPRDNIQVMSQKEYECGSHQCGENTANGLSMHGNLYAVMLDNHGPNIVFNKNIDPSEVIDFIYANFDLSACTSGYEQVYFNNHGKNNFING